MLQQTQVDRVLPKYEAFLAVFPTVRSLADAPLKEVLMLWQGLGYNRRAKNLHASAQEVQHQFRGLTPKSYEKLLSLPGIGPYTASAVMVFAYGVPTPMIETNIRTAYLYHFHHNKNDVADEELLRLIEKTMDTLKPREWYYALMDYGAYIKKFYGNQNGRSKHYKVQSPFKGSDRQIRGAIIRTILKDTLTRTELHRELGFDIQRVDEQLERLITEGLVTKDRKWYAVPD
jgi:A/G-specific adenine glycosylase